MIFWVLSRSVLRAEKEEEEEEEEEGIDQW